MKNCSCVIFPVTDKLLDGEVLLFKSLFDWTKDAATDAGIEKIYCADALPEKLSGKIFVLSAECPLIGEDIIKASFEAHTASDFKMTAILSSRDEEISAAWIDADEADVADFSVGDIGEFFENIGKKVEKVGCFMPDDDLFPVKSTRDLYLANEAARKAVIGRALDAGAVIMCDSGIIISPDSFIKEGALILPGSIIRHGSIIGAGAVIGPNSVIDSSEIGENSIINACVVTESTVGNNVKIGPFTQLRPNSHIKDGAKIGDFVEIKNSTIGEGTAVAHLTYVGDSDVGRKVNFGCGTVTVNYDGKNKFRTSIGDYAFIGCNTNLVAPVKIGTNAFTAAGSTVTKDVPDDSLCVSRAREQHIAEGWVEKKLGKRRYEK